VARDFATTWGKSIERCAYIALGAVHFRVPNTYQLPTTIITSDAVLLAINFCYFEASCSNSDAVIRFSNPYVLKENNLATMFSVIFHSADENLAYLLIF